MKHIYFFILLLLIIPSISASHYIIGKVSGENVDGLNIYLYNQKYGTSENVTDIVGLVGNSRTSGIYMFDCELLKEGCNIGDKLRITINGKYSVLVKVDGFGYDIAPTFYQSRYYGPKQKINYRGRINGS